ncbi:hypothetical protein [Rubellicoccus peritrichatus]|uniref:Lipoprotein n=1 Tax=Rubellicoccus peritrichatus TaxID=3080537 RepID=A0AAQ3QX97_9BACT|nr:hypothetical protein [Puniceicoccus sp. CR14]WOO43458.1 hypothetical protein RZN69_10190 [Puniceicoccus sp. CR14]
MKHFLIILPALVTALFAGCTSAATEEEKRNFAREVRAQEHQQQEEQFDRAIDPNYVPSVGDTPAWEAPAN